MTDARALHTPGDILDQSERNGWAFWMALVMHGALVGGFVAANWLSAHVESFGAKDAGGAAVGVQVVNAIPLPSHGPENRLANDTDSEVPQQQAKQQRVKEVTPPPDAVPIKAKTPKKTAAQEPTEVSHVTKFKQLEQNQLASKTSPAASTPTFAVPGAGRITMGPQATLGTNFAAYASQIQNLIASHWHTETVDRRIQSAPIVTFTFDVMRDGSVRNIHLNQGSGIPLLDASVERAIRDSDPLPPLPAGYKGASATIDSQFELKR